MKSLQSSVLCRLDMTRAYRTELTGIGLLDPPRTQFAHLTRAGPTRGRRAEALPLRPVDGWEKATQVASTRPQATRMATPGQSG